jgi:hypothetical protein
MIHVGAWATYVSYLLDATQSIPRTRFTSRPIISIENSVASLIVIVTG